MSHEIENFFGVYLLRNRNERYKGHTYIGFTVDPNRRIKQHNTGSHAGGAHRTSGRGPWDMVLIIHGFPNKISALRFEWAWQNPQKSKRLRHVTGKRRNETAYQFRFRLVCEMLRTSPWDRLPLTIRWLKQEFHINFDPALLPPTHMPVQFGPVIPKKVVAKEAKGIVSMVTDCDEMPTLTQTQRRCRICSVKLKSDDNTLQCINPECSLISHTLCLARNFLSLEGVVDTQLIPVQGPCLSCKQVFLWGDLIRFKHGCYQNSTSQESDAASSHWTDDLDI